MQDERVLVAAGIHSRRRAADALGVEDPEAEFRRWLEEAGEVRTVPAALRTGANGAMHSGRYDDTAMEELVHHWETQGRTIRFAWVGDVDVTPSRVYALAFTSDGALLLVGGAPDDPDLWLPGGGIEPGESPEEALARELLEEAAATAHAMRRIGSQRVDDPARGSEFHTFYWCRVTLAGEFIPRHEVTQRRLVRPDDFLDTLFWGRRDPKAVVLLDRALEIERELGVGSTPRP